MIGHVRTTSSLYHASVLNLKYLYCLWNLKLSFPLSFLVWVYQKVLAAHGASKVSAYVTHSVFPKRSWERFIHKNDGNYPHCLIYLPFTDTLLTCS